MSTETVALAEQIRESAQTGDPAIGKLKTNDRIIARVTDGIYREPWSAFRELVSNAYDADATRVAIDSDYPFFNQIRISDNGNGMDSNTVADLLTNIGGSSKRTLRGKSIGTVSAKDTTRSPNGRKLIGKIGIGLFAVAQLTQHFQIITKKKGSKERVSATVKINTYREDALAEEDVEYESGSYNVVCEEVGDTEWHGTTIVLMNIKPAVREKRQSQEIWSAQEEHTAEEVGLSDAVVSPNYHIGRVDLNGVQIKAPNLPWKSNDPPDEKFEKLFNATIALGSNSNDRADLSHLDNYLKMMWRLSLGSPVEYLHGHPFDIKGGAGLSFYSISNKRGGSASGLPISAEGSPRQSLLLQADEQSKESEFHVFLDGVKLLRPVSLPKKLVGSTGVSKPLMFIGKASTNFGGASEQRSGGNLSFEAYLYWNSKIIPKESIGALIRVNGASGTLFDPDFLGYQIAEQTRKKQVTCEIFVLEGLDGALNIDRESYNTSHPHFLFIQKWLHSAFRQFATQHKKIGREARQITQEADRLQGQEKLTGHVNTVWQRMRGRDSLPPSIETLGNQLTSLPVLVGGNSITWGQETMDNSTLQNTERVKSLTIVLEAHGVLEMMDDSRRARLIHDIMNIFEA